MSDIVWLVDIGAGDAPLTGGKAARLGVLLRRGFPVPPGFCVTAAAFRAFDVAGDMDQHLRDDIFAACSSLAATQGGTALFAVRSSSPVEDLEDTSFAGQYATYLKVPAGDVPARVLDCWRSASSLPALSYRQAQDLAKAPLVMAVLVQRMVDCDVAGVAFSRDPLTGDAATIVEAAPGLADSVVSGAATPHCYSVRPEQAHPTGDELLSGAALRAIADLALAAEAVFAAPQDVEWGLQQGKLILLQSRPITTLGDDNRVFTDDSDPETIWTAGFFNERFSAPVSPLGWSLLRGPIEQFALLDTLHFLGTPGCDAWPLIRLFRGHPYANMKVFQTMYKVFPNFLLPEDAQRFFTDKDVNIRRKVPFPAGILDPRFLMAMLRGFLRDPRNWSPLHNDSVWRRFSSQYMQAMAEAERTIDASDARELQCIEERIQRLNGRLLAIHRWSLTDADVFYSLLRRLLSAWVSATDAAQLAAGLTTGADNPSLEINRALDTLAHMAADSPDAEANLSIPTSQPSAGAPLLDDALAAFLAHYGHRSPSLDIYHPPLAADRGALRDLISQQALDRSGAAPARNDDRRATQAQAEQRVRAALSRGIERLLPLRLICVRWVTGIARRYLPLRESQRFTWQKGLALLRDIYLRRGALLVARSLLDDPGDVFFLTAEEVQDAVSAAGEPQEHLRTLVRARRAGFDRLTSQWRAAPNAHYPAFLHGNTPLPPSNQVGSAMTGRGISPGIGKGPAAIALSADALAAAPAGSVLVAPSIDPGWTPALPRLAGLVLEVGGQLSHGAIMAREYGVPAVAGIANATTLLRDGDMLIVDGDSGVLRRVPPAAEANA